MAHSKSAKKRINISERNRLRNQVIKSNLKSTLKKFLEAVNDNNVELAKEALSSVCKTIDKAATKGILHKNNAARKKSRLTIKLNALSA